MDIAKAQEIVKEVFDNLKSWWTVSDEEWDEAHKEMYEAMNMAICALEVCKESKAADFLRKHYQYNLGVVSTYAPQQTTDKPFETNIKC